MLININKNRYVIKDNIEDKEIYSTKIISELPTDFDLYNYKYINGELVRDGAITQKTIEDLKKEKISELEIYISNIRSQGIEWNDQLWSADEECEKNLTSQITLLSFAPTEKVNWFSKTKVNELTIEEFKELALVLSSVIANYKMKYYAYKNAIEQCETKEELDNIVFE